MSSLRRDLFERHRWPAVLVIVAAIVAVPVLLHGHSTANAGSTPPPPAAAPAVVAPRHTPVELRRRLQRSRVLRNPFAAGAPRLASHPSSAAGGAAAPARTTSETPTTPTAAALVSPEPSTDTTPSAPDPSGPPDVGGSAGAGATDPGPTTTTVTTTATTTTTTPAPTPPPTGPTSWTIDSVAVRVDADGGSRTYDDLPRLTPLPSAAAPAIMFMGAMGAGRQAVFALGSDVQASGEARCRPDRARCAAIVLAPGQTERLQVPRATGFPRIVSIEVTGIERRTTRSHHDALAAYQRHSEVGRCELGLSNPISYDPADGSLSAAVDRSCRRSRHVVPFPGPPSGS